MRKICPKCKIEKDLSEFNSQKKRCLVCHKEANQKWRDENLEKNRECQRLYTREKRHTPKTKQKTYYKRYYNKNKKAIMAKNAIHAKKRNEYIGGLILEFLQKNPCVDCGEPNPLKLSFDHINDNKSFNIANSVRMGYSEERIFKEIAKCEVRCFNCHMERTAIKGNFIRHILLNKSNNQIRP